LNVQVSITVVGVIMWVIVVVMMPHCMTAIATSAHVFKAFKAIGISGFAMELKV
jgi:hypothetical protein